MTKTIYYLYHIPGKKIGITRNLKDRLTIQQGYQTGEYEVLDSSDDIDYISARELELQLIYGYKIDRQSYKNLINKKQNEMVLNVTEQTTTFPCPVNKLKGNLFDNLGIQFKTGFGSYTLTPVIAEWIVKNANVSMFNPSRTYVYNKALEEFAKTLVEPKAKSKQTDNIYNLIRKWANERGIYTSGDTKTQCLKLQEEVGELSSAILKNNKQEIIDAIGDCVVVLTNLAVMKNLNIEDCIESAYNEIKDRKGSMQNGTFVKDGPWKGATITTELHTGSNLLNTTTL
ncbi:MAG: MazG-like family protein [Candidatus Fonsibacter sp.]